MRNLDVLLLTGCLFAASFPAAARGATPTTDRAFPIQLHTRSFAGYRANIEVSDAMVSTSSDRWDGGEAAERETSAGLRMAADVTFLKVDADGDVTAEAAVIRTAERTLPGGQKQEVLPSGAQVSLSAGPDGLIYLVNGKPPADDVRYDLNRICAVASPKEERLDADAMYGSKAPRKIGETWPVNAAEAVKLFKRRHIDVTAADLSGTVKLVGVETVDDTECLRIEVETKVDHYRPPAPDDDKPASGVTLHAGTMLEKIVWLVPVDGKGEMPRTSYSIDVHVSTSGTVGKRHFVSDIHERKSSEKRVKPLRPDAQGSSGAPPVAVPQVQP